MTLQENKMAHNPLTIDLLRTLDAIERTGSFAKAAETLFKVPSALTYTVQKVEHDLDLPLFDRSGHRATLTPAGLLITQRGRQILAAIDNLAQQARLTASGVEAQVSLAIDTAMPLPAIWSVLQGFQQQFPSTELHIRETVLSQTWEVLLSNQVQLALSTQELDPKLGGYEVTQLRDLAMVFCTHPHHPLAQCSEVADKENLSRFSNVSIKDPGKLLAGRSLGWVNPGNRLLVDNMQAKINAQVAGLGIGYLPLERIQQELSNGSLVRLDHQLPPHHSPMVLAVSTSASGPASQWLRQQLQHCLRQP